MQEPQMYKGATSDGLNVYVLPGQPQDEVWVFDNATMKKIDVIRLEDVHKNGECNLRSGVPKQ